MHFSGQHHKIDSVIARTVLDFAAAVIKEHLWKWQHVLHSSKNY